jgi:hypothetical protein
MYLIYYDESGDDGFPNGASPIFTLSANYIHEDNWRIAFNTIKDFRLSIKSKLPSKMEIHVKDFLLGKKPFRQLNLSDIERVSIIEDYCSVVSVLPLQIVNVVINKSIIKKTDYLVLDTALTYSIQRIDNSTKIDKLIIISDDGRISKMRKTTRRIQVFNNIPSRSTPGKTASHPIERLIEDPLPKVSSNSFFVQISDLAAFLVYNYMLIRLTKKSLNPRFPTNLTDKTLNNWLSILDPVLNTEATKNNKYGHGIVCYPHN